MITVGVAKALIQEKFITGQKVKMLVQDALGFCLAEDVRAPLDVPSFDNSAMDGYAISWSEKKERILATGGLIQAGDQISSNPSPDSAVRIFTGAPIPQGTDTVIPQEWVSISDKKLSFDPSKFIRGSNVRYKGMQNRKGDVVATIGSPITPGMVGLLSSLGIAEVVVYNPPGVGIILTGNELQPVGNALAEGKIYDANGPVLHAYLKQMGIRDITLKQVMDDAGQLNLLILEMLERCDILLISGGISVGDFDFVKKGLELAGVEEIFYKVRQKPGKPLFVGQLQGRKWVFALPGNPASTLTCFNQYVKPAIQAWLGKKTTFAPLGSFPLAEPFKKSADLTFFLKASLLDGKVHILPGQESFNLISYGSANCIAEVDEQTQLLNAGDLIKVYEW
jgi:molybdopterin molybdotransferase